jgi:hypothetical protein
VTRRLQRSARGNRRTSAAITARSAQSKRGRVLVRRRTATSWRNNRSSTSLAADVRPINRSSPSTRQKIKYSNRSDTPGSWPTSDHRWSATQDRLLAPHTVPELTLELGGDFCFSEVVEYYFLHRGDERKQFGQLGTQVLGVPSVRQIDHRWPTSESSAMVPSTPKSGEAATPVGVQLLWASSHQERIASQALAKHAARSPALGGYAGGSRLAVNHAAEAGPDGGS